MKKFFFALLGVLAMATAAQADIFVLPINATWTSTQLTTSVPFNLPPDGFGIRVESIIIEVEHARAGDLQFSVTTGFDLFNLRNIDGGDFELGSLDSPGNPAPYTFVESGGVLPPGWAPLGGGLMQARTWVSPPPYLPYTGWFFQYTDPVEGNGGTIRNVSIDYVHYIPEPMSALVLLGLSAVVVVRHRREAVSEESV